MRRRSRPWPGSPSDRRGGTRRGGSPGRGTSAGRRSRTDRASRRDRPASSQRSRRTSATMSCDVGPGRLRRRRGSRPRPARAVSGRRRRRVARPRRGRRACLVDGQRIVAPAARACPPPPKAPVRTVASTPPGFVRTLIRVAAAGLLEDDRDLGLLGLGEEVDDPLGVRRDRAGLGQIRVEQARRGRSGRRRSAPSRCEDGAEQPELGFGLRSIEPPRDVGQRGARLDEGRRDRERAGRRVRMGERRRVHDDAGHEQRRQGAVALVERHAEPQPRAASIISQVAAASGSIQSASPRSSFEAW